MKLRTIVECFDTIKKVYDSLTEFTRKWELVPAYNELRDAVKLFNEERAKVLEGLKIGKQIPPDKMQEANNLVEKIAKNEMTLKHSVLFTKEEIENSKITGSEIALLIENFIKT